MVHQFCLEEVHNTYTITVTMFKPITYNFMTKHLIKLYFETPIWNTT